MTSRFNPQSYFSQLSVSTLTTEAEALQHAQKHNLPFSRIGDKYEGTDFRSAMIGIDQFSVEVKPHSVFGPYGSSQAFTCDASTMKQVIDGENLPHLGLYRMTDKESQELDEIEKSFSKWRTQQELNKFKALPRNIRQEIVDEALIADLFRHKPEVDETKFQDWKRMQELKAKRNPELDTMLRGYPQQAASFNFKYSPIINRYTSQQLLTAHADASLEEELED